MKSFFPLDFRSNPQSDPLFTKRIRNTSKNSQYLYPMLECNVECTTVNCVVKFKKVIFNYLSYSDSHVQIKV